MKRNIQNIKGGAGATAAPLLQNIKSAGRVSLDLHGGGTGAGHSLAEIVLAEREERAQAAGMGAGDIITSAKGAGIRKRLAVSMDDEAKRARAAAAFAAKSPRCAAIAERVRADADAADALTAAAVSVAQKQARKVFEFRGVRPSAESIADAAAVARVAMWYGQQAADAVSLFGCTFTVEAGLCGSKPEAVTPDQLADVGGRGHWIAARFGARVAFQSLTKWGAAGMTAVPDSNSRASRVTVCTVGLDAAAHIPSGADVCCDWETTAAARWSAARRLYRVAVAPFMGRGGAAGAAALRAAAARGRVLACGMFGHSIELAAKRGGFATVQNFVESCKAAGLRQSLRAVAIDGAAAVVDYARNEARAYALDAGDGARHLRMMRRAAIASVALVGGGGGILSRRQRPAAILDGGAAAVEFKRVRRELGADVRAAQWWQGVARRHVQAAAAAADNLFDGLQRRDWRTVAGGIGMEDKLGRASRKLNPAFISRARGNGARRMADAQTQSKTVGNARRRLPCAPLA